MPAQLQRFMLTLAALSNVAPMALKPQWGFNPENPGTTNQHVVVEEVSDADEADDVNAMTDGPTSK